MVYLPTDFPPYRLVNYYYNKWTDNRTLEEVNTALRQHLREKKVETQTRRQPSLTVKASREPQNPIWNQGSREASSLKEEKAISSSYNGLSDYRSGIRSQRVLWESGSSAHNGSVLIPSYHHKNLGRQWLFRPGAFRLALASNSDARSRSVENKESREIVASACGGYLFLNGLKCMRLV